jgi:hypothetical protein
MKKGGINMLVWAYANRLGVETRRQETISTVNCRNHVWGLKPPTGFGRRGCNNRLREYFTILTQLIFGSSEG